MKGDKSPLSGREIASGVNLLQILAGTCLAPDEGMQQPFNTSFRDAFRQPPEIVVARTAAACIHPVAAWRVLPAPWRIFVLAVYTVTSYLTVLTVLIALNP